MAKRSIEIAISASNQTAGGLSGAKAELQRWGDDVKRIQANVRAAAMGGDIPAAIGQQRLLGGAQERRATAMQAAEGQAALQQRLAAFKAERAEIGKSVEGTRQVADNSRRIAEHAGKGADGFGKMGVAAIKMGAVLAAARVATQAMRIATAAIEGDWNGIADAIKGIPVIGGLAEAGGGLAVAIHRRATGFTPEVRKEIEGLNDASDKLHELRAAAEKRGRELGMTEDQKFAAKWGEARAPAIEAMEKFRDADLRAEEIYQDKLVEIAAMPEGGRTTGEMGMGSGARKRASAVALAEREKAREVFLAGEKRGLAAMAEIDKTFKVEAHNRTLKEIADRDAADEAEKRRKETVAHDEGMERRKEANAEYDRVLQEAQETEDIQLAAAERRKRIKEYTAGEIARLKVETTTEKGLAREMALLDLRRQKELANTELTEELKAAIREKYGLLELQARQGQPAAADAAARRRPEAPGIPAIERGFLTRVPGRQWEVEGLAAQKKIAANTKATADATKDLVKAYESIDKMTGQVRSYAPTIAHF